MWQVGEDRQEDFFRQGIEITLEVENRGNMEP